MQKELFVASSPLSFISLSADSWLIFCDKLKYLVFVIYLLKAIIALQLPRGYRSLSSVLVSFAAFATAIPCAFAMAGDFIRPSSCSRAEG